MLESDAIREFIEAIGDGSNILDALDYGLGLPESDLTEDDIPTIMELLDEYCLNAFDEHLDADPSERIPMLYTTVCNDSVELQLYFDLSKMEMVCVFGGEEKSRPLYMIDFEWLDFDSLYGDALALSGLSE